MRVVLALALVMSMAVAAHANEWTVTGQTCMPADTAVQGDLYVTAFSGLAAIQWNSGKTGIISMFCSIPVNIAPSPTHVELYFKNDMSCAGCSADYVRVTYYKMNKSSASVSPVATVDSSSGTNDGSYQGISTTISDAYNASTYVYFVRVDMVRGASSTNTLQTFYSSVVY